jgi:hypothetical protein
MWLARVSDKGRAHAAGTIFDYIYPCPMDQGVLERWKVTPAEFDVALAQHPTDDALLGWLSGRTDASHAETANAWLTEEKSENLDRQDREEGVTSIA